MQKISSNTLLEISKDGLEGYITVLDDETLDIFFNKEDTNVVQDKKSVEQIIKEIKDILKIGLDEAKLRSTLLNKKYNDKVCIAEGILPIDGKDGHIKYNFDLEKKLTPKVLEDGTVDYRELDIINNVNKGDIVAEITLPREGKSGSTVTGESIPFKEGKYPKFKYGKNIKFLEDKGALVAEKDGLVTLKNGQITVLDVFKVENVDNSVGNIYFDGSVVVQKNVLNGFQVKANGDVEVRGVVEGGFIENTGNVIIKKGIQGYKKLVVKTKGNITTKFVENAIIDSAKDIIAEAIMHSEVSSKSNIKLIGKRGLIVGGICRAGKEIIAKTIGSTMATTTILEVGVEPKIKEDSEKLINNIDELEDNLEKVKKTLNLLDKLKKANRLDKDKEELYEKLLKTNTNMEASLKGLKKEYNTINEYISNLSRGKVKVSGVIHPGVKIIIGNSSMTVRDEMKRCTFYRDEGEIKIGPYWE